MFKGGSNDKTYISTGRMRELERELKDRSSLEAPIIPKEPETIKDNSLSLVQNENMYLRAQLESSNYHAQELEATVAALKRDLLMQKQHSEETLAKMVSAFQTKQVSK